MSGITMEEMRLVAKELRQAVRDHDQLCAELPALTANHKRDYLKAHAASTTFHPERKVKEHEIEAEQSSFDSWAALNAAEYGLKALKEKMHSYRQILSAFQTQVRTEGRLAGQFEASA